MFFTIKKYDIISSIIFLLVLAATCSIINYGYKSVTASSLPFNKKIIVIDAGHGNPDGGAIGINGSIEQQINLKVSLKLQRLLEQSGAYVILTRSDENSVSEELDRKIREIKRDDLKIRKDMRDNSGCDAFISIHMNKFEEEKYSGAQVFYGEYPDGSKNLGECIQSNLKLHVDQNNNRAAKLSKDIYLLKHAQVPSVVVECGFLSNAHEEALLNDENYQNKIAYGIYHGIVDYFDENRVQN